MDTDNAHHSYLSNPRSKQTNIHAESKMQYKMDIYSKKGKQEGKKKEEKSILQKKVGNKVN